MSNYIYEEHIIIPKYSGNITLTSGSASKMYNGSALSNHTVTQSNLVITDLNTNTQASNPKFTADYGSWPSIIDENTSVQNSFVASNKRWYINNTEDITQYIAAEDEHITKKFGTLSITDNPTYPNIGGGRYTLRFNSWSGSDATQWGYNEITPAGDKGSVSPNNITINGSIFNFGYIYGGFTGLYYTTNMGRGKGAGYTLDFWRRSAIGENIYNNCNVYIKNINNNAYKILPCYFIASSSDGYVSWGVESPNDDLNFKTLNVNMPFDIYFVPK